MKRVLMIVAVMGMAMAGAQGVAHAQVNGWENLRRSNGSLRPDSYTAGRAVQGSQSGGTRGNHPGMAAPQARGGGHVQSHGGSYNMGHNHGYRYQPNCSPYRPVYRYPAYYYYPRPVYYVPPAGRWGW